MEEADIFRAVTASGARALLIGRRALIAWGLPVLTADYDYWLDPDDVERFNAALAPPDLMPNRSPEEARARGRYVLENIDVLIARRVSTVDSVMVDFDDVWRRRRSLPYDSRATIEVPDLDDLILTKRWGSRDKDLADIKLLEALKGGAGS